MQKFIFIFKQKVLYFLRIVFGRCFSDSECIACGNQSYGELICSLCAEKLLYRRILVPSFLQKRCSCCGKPLLSEVNLCMECRRAAVIKSVDFVFPVFTYRLWLKNMLFEWKSHGVRSLSFVFAKICAIALRNNGFDSCKNIVPVPPRPGKLRKKGWDQIEETVEFLEAFYGFSVYRLLERRSGIQQKKKDRISRIADKNPFVPSKLCRSLVNKKLVPGSVVILDDVITTGSTVERCASVLKEAGVSEIKVLSVFIVD